MPGCGVAFPHPVLTLRDMTIGSVYGTLWRYRLFILVTTAVLVGAALFVTMQQTKLYTASSLIRVQQQVTGAEDIYGALQTGERLARTYAKVATTRSVASQVRKQLPASVPTDAIDIKATQVGNLELLELSVTYSDPRIAARVANAVPAALATFIAKTGSARDTITLIEAATPPTTPSSPNLKLTIAIAVILGLVLNSGLALLHNAVSDRVQSAEDLERATGHPVIVTIPTLRFGERIPAAEPSPGKPALAAMGDRGGDKRRSISG
jgi:succinoglycan biosynthesis transport protein ExoP